MGFVVTTIDKHYAVYSKLNEAAGEHGAEFVVMGSLGSEVLKEILVGSDAEKLVRHADIPNIVIMQELENLK